MSDNYEYIHHATDSKIAEMLEELANLWSFHPKEELEILIEAAKRLRIPPHPTFHEEYMGEC